MSNLIEVGLAVGLGIALAPIVLSLLFVGLISIGTIVVSTVDWLISKF